jgi:hypothetical protein
MPRPSRKRYTGVLLKPMTPLLLKGSREELEAAHLRCFKELAERRDALLQHYGIDDDGSEMPFRKLALALATEWVPGFRFEPPKSRALSPETTRDTEILIVLGKAEHADKSVNAAAGHLAKRWGGGVKATTIRQRYYTLKRGGSELQRVARLLKAYEGIDKKL